MKKQKVFILVQHGVDSQDNSCVDVVGVYSTKTAAKKKMAEVENNILDFYEDEYPDYYETRRNLHGVAHARIVPCLMSC